jgi:hypothetical protein
MPATLAQAVGLRVWVRALAALLQTSANPGISKKANPVKHARNTPDILFDFFMVTPQYKLRGDAWNMYVPGNESNSVFPLAPESGTRLQLLGTSRTSLFL